MLKGERAHFASNFHKEEDFCQDIYTVRGGKPKTGTESQKYERKVYSRSRKPKSIIVESLN